MTGPADKSPLIGITTRREPDREGSSYLSLDYSIAVYESGGLPVTIPLMDPPHYLNQLALRLDGIIFSGSASDVAPERYGQSPQPGLGPVDTLRDAVDTTLAREAMGAGMPVFGICYGFQMLNVLLGGTLIQDLASRPGGPPHQRLPGATAHLVHPVSLEPDSILGRLAGRESVEVVSSHHQAVGRLADRLRVTALSPDGVIEAAEHTSIPLIAVQWHPERNLTSDVFSRRIFEHFVAACREYGKQKAEGGRQ
jgi:putative glutamine amidotransferase